MDEGPRDRNTVTKTQPTKFPIETKNGSENCCFTMRNPLHEEKLKEKCEGDDNFVQDAIDRLGESMEANEQIEMLKANIEKDTASAEKLTQEVAECDEYISVWNGDVKTATKVYEMEKTDCHVTHKNYLESVDALECAIAVLKAGISGAIQSPQAGP